MGLTQLLYTDYPVVRGSIPYWITSTLVAYVDHSVIRWDPFPSESTSSGTTKDIIAVSLSQHVPQLPERS